MAMRKQLLMFITTLLFSSMLYAQNYHWSGFNYNSYFTYMHITGKAYFDGELQDRPNIEVAAFVGDELRGSKFLFEPYPNSSQGYYVWTSCYFNIPGETFTFKAYDHDNLIEYDLCSVQLVGQQNGYGDVNQPVDLYFTRSGGQNFTKEIIGHNGENGHWYFIASPLAGETNPTTIAGMIVADDDETTDIDESEYYDLYRFNQNSESEWQNYKHKLHSEGFVIEPGRGYLYANKNTVMLTFAGIPYSGNGEVPLEYSNENPDENMRGWNLIGNPFGTAATLDLPFFKMNEGGTALQAQVETTNSQIDAMEGVFVYAYDESLSQVLSTATFTAVTTRSNNDSHALVNINLMHDEGTLIDNAIVRFDAGRQLPKFYFGESDANIYIPRNGKDYAITTVETQGELPINFKAAKNDTYTLSVNIENTEMVYLHLIDNQTGIDVDLLSPSSRAESGNLDQPASYTFNANTTDYASRFKLVFVSGQAVTDDNFIFYNNDSWIIANEGEASLQVIDINGRILSSERINGNVTKHFEVSAGVYIIRLVNGADEKTQKIVVR